MKWGTLIVFLLLVALLVIGIKSNALAQVLDTPLPPRQVTMSIRAGDDLTDFTLDAKTTPSERILYHVPYGVTKVELIYPGDLPDNIIVIRPGYAVGGIRDLGNQWEGNKQVMTLTFPVLADPMELWTATVPVRMYFGTLNRPKIFWLGFWQGPEEAFHAAVKEAHAVSAKQLSESSVK